MMRRLPSLFSAQNAENADRELLDLLDELGPYVAKKIAGEQWGAVCAMTYGKGRIMIGHVQNLMFGADASYCYRSVPEAIEALERWQGGEPEGYFRKL